MIWSGWSANWKGRHQATCFTCSTFFFTEIQLLHLQRQKETWDVCSTTALQIPQPLIHLERTSDGPTASIRFLIQWSPHWPYLPATASQMVLKYAACAFRRLLDGCLGPNAKLGWRLYAAPFLLPIVCPLVLWTAWKDWIYNPLQFLLMTWLLVVPPVDDLGVPRCAQDQTVLVFCAKPVQRSAMYAGKKIMRKHHIHVLMYKHMWAPCFQYEQN